MLRAVIFHSALMEWLVLSHDSPFLRGLDVIYRDLYQAGFKIRVDSFFFFFFFFFSFHLHPFLSPLLSPSVCYLLLDLSEQSYFHLHVSASSVIRRDSFFIRQRED